MPVMPMQYDNNQRVRVVEERNDLNQVEYNVNDIMLNEGSENQVIYYEDFDKNNEVDGEMEKD